MQNKNLDPFIDQLLLMKDKKEMKKFLGSILTPAELLEIPTRLKIVRMLKAGKTHREIAEELGVGIATVARGSRELKQGSFRNIK